LIQGDSRAGEILVKIIFQPNSETVQKPMNWTIDLLADQGPRNLESLNHSSTVLSLLDVMN